MRAVVLGAGSWGTTFAKVLTDAGTDTILWARRDELARTINHEHVNPDYLPGIALPESLRATHDTDEAFDGADLVVLALPSQAVRANLSAWTDRIPADASLVSLAKGIELGTVQRMSEVISEVTGAEPERVLVLSGPNLAHEIAEQQPTATVIAGLDPNRAAVLQKACSTPYFRPYTNTDVIGTELAGSVKNVIALACGMAAGMGFGDNTLASLITRGLAETARLGAELGADPMTFAGLAGLGDLVATCASPLSRNRAFGFRLGQGETVASAHAAGHGQVAEGVNSCRAVLDLADRHSVDVPITWHVASVCHGQAKPADAVRTLMQRSVRSE